MTEQQTVEKLWELVRRFATNSPCWNAKLCGQRAGSGPPAWTCPRCEAEGLILSAAVLPPSSQCDQHPHVTLRCPACAGSRGGQVRSPKKAKASRKAARRERPRGRGPRVKFTAEEVKEISA